MKYDILLEKLMQHFTAPPYEEEVLSAKREFYELAGIFDEESPQFEMKMAQFMDWYLFTRPLLMRQEVPICFALEGGEYKIPEELETYYKNLADHCHSLFEFLKLKGTDLHIRDLFSGYKYVIKKSEITVGFDKSQYFEARLIPHEGSYVFSKSFCVHPPQGARYIDREAKRIKKIKDEDERNLEKEKLILKLFRMRYKHEQYQHIDLSEIYSNESRLRL